MLTRAIGAQWAAVWSGVRDPLCAPWAQWRRAVSCSSALVETPAMRSVTRDRLQTIRGSGQARPSGVVHCPGGAGPHCVAAAVGEPADSIENALQNHGAVVNRRGWIDGRATPNPLWRTGHPKNPPLHPSGCWTEGLLATAIRPSTNSFPRRAVSQAGRRRFESGLPLHVFNDLQGFPIPSIPSIQPQLFDSLSTSVPGALNLTRSHLTGVHSTSKGSPVTY